MGIIKQQFKGKILTRTTVKNNILKIWSMTDDTERHDWYANVYKVKQQDGQYAYFLN